MKFPRLLSIHKVRPFSPPAASKAGGFLIIVLVASWVVACGLQNPAPSRPQPGNSTQAAITDERLEPAVAKIWTGPEGLYELDVRSLAGAGFTPAHMQAGSFRLYLQGQPQPFWLDGEGKNLKLRFYAPASTSRYSRENVLWLFAGGEEADLPFNPARLEPVADRVVNDLIIEPLDPPSADRLPPGSAWASAVFEENLLYNPQVEGADHWLWVSLPAPQSQFFEIPARAAAGGPARLRLSVWSNTEAPANPDHRLVLQVNEQVVAEVAWDGRGAQQIEAELPDGLLQDGQNQVEVSAPGVEGVAAEIHQIDRIELVYARRLSAEEDRLEIFGYSGQADLESFSGPVDIYELDGSLPPARVAAQALPKSGFEFQAGKRYRIVGSQGYRTPVKIAPMEESLDLRAPEMGADWVAVGPPDLLEALQPLMDWREQQGLKTLAVPVEAVYDQFNAGLPEPQAVQAWLRWAAENWDPAPRFVLLVGDGSYDPRGYLATPEANRLPTFLVETVYGGETASDVPFTQLDEDQQPDVALGRIPARRPEQMAVLVQKILAFEQSGKGEPWRQRVLAVADGQEPAFRADAQSFLDLFPDPFQADLFAPPPGAEGANGEIRQLLDTGAGLVAYFGHGSVNMWGKDSLFTTEDASALENGAQTPVMLHMTCLNGLFTHPKVESLAETLLWQPDGGAVAVLAPTSLTLPGDQTFLWKPLVESLLSEDLTLGEALLQARRNVPVQGPGTLDVMQTFLLFGDPALTLPGMES